MLSDRSLLQSYCCELVYGTDHLDITSSEAESRCDHTDDKLTRIRFRPSTSDLNDHYGYSIPRGPRGHVP
jgi:hypothetical protein